MGTSSEPDAGIAPSGSGPMIIGMSIPISGLVTFAPMLLLDVSLNIMSLGGLALGVGMLVDNAIVVLESITRCREEGDELSRAAVRGVSEVAGAITASTLTTVAVFAPIVFVHGIAGQIFSDQAVTVVSSLLVSLLVAVLFILFDVESLLLIPWAVGARGFADAGVGGIVFMEILGFVGVLAVGLAYVWRKGGLVWDR